MKSVYPRNKEFRIQNIRGTAFALSNEILSLKKDEDTDMTEEIMQYLTEKLRA